MSERDSSLRLPAYPQPLFDPLQRIPRGTRRSRLAVFFAPLFKRADQTADRGGATGETFADGQGDDLFHGRTMTQPDTRVDCNRQTLSQPLRCPKGGKP